MKASNGHFFAGFAVSALVLGGAAVRADLTWDIQQLTFDGGTKASVSAQNGSVAWSRFDGSQSEVFLWNGSTIANLTTATGQPGSNVSLYHGTVAGEAADGIYTWNGATATRITSDTGNPSLYDGTIAWTHLVSPGTTFELQYWNGATIQTLDTWSDPTHDSWGCSLYQGKVAYKSGGVGGGVWYWDGTRRIQVDGNGGAVPSLYDGKIAYVQGGNYISYWDGEHLREVDAASISPSLCSGQVAYCKLVNNKSWEIMFWDGTATAQVTHGTADVLTPSLDVNSTGTCIAWLQDVGGGNQEVFYAKLVPEPSMAALLLLGLAGVARRRRRRDGKNISE